MTGAIILLSAFLLGSIVHRISVVAHHKPQPSAAPTAVSDQGYDAEKGKLDKTLFDGTVLPETEDAGQEYVDSTLFLGDSNTARFLRILNPDTKKAFTSRNNTIGVVGMGIDAISSLACMDFSTGRVTMPQAVKLLQPERVIITFGTNNLYGTSTDTTSFISRYEKQIRAIETAYPSVDIIVNSIPPVSKVRSYTNVSMIQIDAYNKAIAEMCEAADWKFLDSSEALKDEKTGYARNGYMASDGLHMDREGLKALFKYIRTHAYITDDDRPKPLASIPTVIGVPDGLIQINPLNDSEFTEESYKEAVESESAEEQTPSPEPTASATPETTPDTTPQPTETPASEPIATAAPTVDPTPVPTPEQPVQTEETVLPEPTVVPPEPTPEQVETGEPVEG